MRPDELDRLLWEQSEGAISAADRERLAVALAADPEADRQRRGVEACVELLAAVPEVPVPPALRPGIDRALAGREHPRVRVAQPSILERLLAPPQRPRLAWAAAGILFAVATTALLVTNSGPVAGGGDERFYGALVAGPVAPSGAETVLLPEGLGSLTLSGRDGALLCQLRLARAVEGGVSLDVTGSGVTVHGFESDGVAASQIASAANAVGVAIRGTGSATLVVRIAAPPQDVTVRITAAGRAVFERAVGITGGARH